MFKRFVTFLSAIMLLAFLATTAMANYQVKKGDTPFKIWKAQGCYATMSLQEFMQLNGISDPRKLQIGKKIKTTLPDSRKLETSCQKELPVQPARDYPKSAPKILLAGDPPSIPSSAPPNSPSLPFDGSGAPSDIPQATKSKELAFQMAWDGTAPIHEYVDARGSINWSRGETSEANKNLTSRYLDLGMYPFQVLSGEERFYLGGGWRYQDWWGESASGSDFEGERNLFNLGLKVYSRDWDLGVRFFLGKQETWARNAAGTWEGEQGMKLLGPGLSGGYYARKNLGNSWFSEVTFWASYLWAFDQYGESSYKGKALPEGSYSNEVLGVWSAGARVYVYDAYRDTPIPIRTFAELTGFGDIPFSPSFVAAIGITDKWEMLEASVGFRLTDGGMSMAGVAINADRIVQKLFKAARQSDVVFPGQDSGGSTSMKSNFASSSQDQGEVAISGGNGFYRVRCERAPQEWPTEG